MAAPASPTAFWLNCDSQFQIRDFSSAMKYFLPAPLETECKYIQSRFDITRRDVPQLPGKCFEKSYIYKGATNTWYKCCTEVLGLSGLVSARPQLAQLACQKLEAIEPSGSYGEGVRIPKTRDGRMQKWRCFHVRPENRVTLGYTDDPGCFCPEGRNGSCWCPDAKSECVPLGKENKAAVGRQKAYSVYYIP
eukprot:g13268.t1